MEVMSPRLLLKYINATNIINIIGIIAPKNLLDLVDKKYCNPNIIIKIRIDNNSYI